MQRAALVFVRAFSTIVLAVGLSGSACTTDPEPKPDDGADTHDESDPKLDGQAAEDPPAKGDPPASGPESNRETGDGSETGGGDTTASGSEKRDRAPAPIEATTPKPGPSALQASLYNHAIVKLKGETPRTPEGLAAFASKATGQQVKEIRPGPMGVMLVVFEAVDPPRDAAARDSLLAALRSTDGFEYVEANRVMHAKDNAGASSP